MKPKNWENLYTPKINKKRSKALKGKNKSQKTKKKMSESKKGKSREPFSKEWKDNIRKAKIGKLRPEITGNKNPNWKGGISREPYSIDWRETLKRSIRERDNYICQLCSQYGNVVHHIDYNKKNCNPDNLIILCRKCNIRVNFNRNYWINYFKRSTN